MHIIYYHIKNTSREGGRAREGGREEGKGGRKGLQNSPKIFSYSKLYMHITHCILFQMSHTSMHMMQRAWIAP